MSPLQNKSKLIIFFYVISLAIKAWAQTDSLGSKNLSLYYSPANILRFGDFLFQRRDYPRAAAEYQRYLFSGSITQQHYVLYQLGRCYIKTEHIDQASEYFQKAAITAPRSTFRDSATAALAASLLIAKRTNKISKKIDSLYSTVKLSALKNEILAFKGIYYLRQKQWQNVLETFKPLSQKKSEKKTNDSFEPILQLAKRGMNLPHKSRLLAGFMSAIVPGSGKIYAGSPYDGIYSLLLVAGTFWLAYDGFYSNGISSFKGWFFGSLATFFYAGNVYGSTVAVKFYNKRFEDKLVQDVETQLSLWIHF